jgi:hypothetical protein
MPAHVFAGDVEILRGDLAGILYQATREGTEYLFGDSITRLDERPGGVDVWEKFAIDIADGQNDALVLAVMLAVEAIHDRRRQRRRM